VLKPAFTIFEAFLIKELNTALLWSTPFSCGAVPQQRFKEIRIPLHYHEEWVQVSFPETGWVVCRKTWPLKWVFEVLLGL